MTQVHAKSTFLQLFTGSLGVIQPLVPGSNSPKIPANDWAEPICRTFRTHHVRWLDYFHNNSCIHDKNVKNSYACDTSLIVWRVVESKNSFVPPICCGHSKLSFLRCLHWDWPLFSSKIGPETYFSMSLLDSCFICCMYCFSKSYSQNRKLS